MTFSKHRRTFHFCIPIGFHKNQHIEILQVLSTEGLVQWWYNLAANWKTEIWCQFWFEYCRIPYIYNKVQWNSFSSMMDIGKLQIRKILFLARAWGTVTCLSTCILTGDLVIGGIVGVARETTSINPSTEFPRISRASLPFPWGARVKSPILLSSNLHSSRMKVPSANQRYAWVYPYYRLHEDKN